MDIMPIAARQDNYIWAIINEAHQVWMVDPGEAGPVLSFIEQKQLTLRGILVTHHHGDHTGGISALRQAYEIPVYGPCQSPCTQITQQLEDGASLVLDEHLPAWTVMSTPGHTLDHVAYYAPGIVFCGDLLFAAGCGRVFEGSMVQMYQSIQRLAHLPQTTKLYCAHEYTLDNLRFAELVEPSNIKIKQRLTQVRTLRAAGRPTLPTLLKDELDTNPFLRCTQPMVKQRVEQEVGCALNHEVDVFTQLRLWKNAWH